MPGDLVIGAIFDIHEAGPGPFMCGDIKGSNGALYTEVFNFALNRINSGAASVALDNFRLGGKLHLHLQEKTIYVFKDLMQKFIFFVCTFFSDVTS